MVQKFCYCRFREAFTPDVVVFRLWVGTTKRDRVLLSLLENFAEDCRHYLRPWDNETDLWLIQRSRAIYPQSQFPNLLVRKIDINIREFYDMLMQGNVESVEKSVKHPSGFSRMMSIFEPKFYLEKIEGGKRGICPRGRRKNLLFKVKDDKTRAAINFGLILVLLILDAIVSHFIGY